MPLKSAKMEFGFTVGELAAHFSSHRLPNGGCSIPSITSVSSKQARFHVHAFMYGNMGQSVPRCVCRAWQTILHVSPYLPRTKDRAYLLFATVPDRLTDPQACHDLPVSTSHLSIEGPGC